jgi:hypothetical protein
MEEKPPTQASRDVPRSRTPRAPFSTPEQPTPPSKPAERAPRRASKPAPPVTFQPPSGDSNAHPPGRPPRKTSSGTPAASPNATPAPEPSAEPADDTRTPTPRKAQAPRKQPPAKQPPAKQPPATKPRAKATPAKATRAATEPAATEPAQPEPVKATPPATEPAYSPPPVQGQLLPEATPPAKAAKKAARKATRPAAAKAQPAVSAQAQPAATVDLPAAAAIPVPAAAPKAPAVRRRTEAWAQLIADPGHAPELAALAAVQTIGPRAAEWARRTREAYPNATDDGLARLATKQFTRFGSLSSIFSAVAGSYAPIALLGAAALTHAELILHVAAAYGVDPTDEARATDLLVLTRVHPTREDAAAALAAAQQPAYSDDAKLTDAVWRFGRMAATQAGWWLALRTVNRFYPGTGLLVATLTSQSAAQAVGHRATAYYSQESQSFGSTV